MLTAPRLRVAHVIHSLGAGGAEAVLAELVGPARAAGLDLVVVGLSDAEDDRAAVSLRDAGATVHQLHAARYDLRAVRAVEEILLRERAQVVHTHLKHADLVGGLAAKRAHLPAVSTLHLIEDGPTTWWHHARVLTAVQARKRLFQRVVVLSRAQREWYRTVSPDAPACLIPNGVRPPQTVRDRQELRAELGVPHDGVLAVTVSLMRPEKGHTDLLEAVHLLHSPDVVVVLAGDGPLLGQVRAQVSADPVLARRVRILGFRQDVDDLLSAADLVVHPSHEDALPTALVSALAAGRPIVGTQVGGIPDIVGEGCGTLVPAGDVEALAEAIDELATQPGTRAQMGAAGRRKYVAEFSAEVWAERLGKLYRELLASSGTSRSMT